MESKLSHPCKQTCSGWQQGYEEGKESASVENSLLRSALEEVLFDLRTMNTSRLHTNTIDKVYAALSSPSKTPLSGPATTEE